MRISVAVILIVLSVNSFSQTKNVVSRKVQSINHYEIGVRTYNDLRKCVASFQKSLFGYKKCVEKNLASSIPDIRKSKISHWISVHKELSDAYVCKDELLDRFHHTSESKYVLVLCADFKELKRTKTALLFYEKEKGKLKLSGIKY